MSRRSRQPLLKRIILEQDLKITRIYKQCGSMQSLQWVETNLDDLQEIECSIVIDNRINSFWIRITSSFFSSKYEGRQQPILGVWKGSVHRTQNRFPIYKNLYEFSHWIGLVLPRDSETLPLDLIYICSHTYSGKLVCFIAGFVSSFLAPNNAFFVKRCTCLGRVEVEIQ